MRNKHDTPGLEHKFNRVQSLDGALDLAVKGDAFRIIEHILIYGCGRVSEVCMRQDCKVATSFGMHL